MRKDRQKIIYKRFKLTDCGFPEIPIFGSYNTEKALQPLESHTHKGFEICYLVKGHQNYSVFGKDYLLKSGDIFLTKPGEMHSSGRQSQEKGQLYWIHILPLTGNKNMFGLNKEEGNMNRVIQNIDENLENNVRVPDLAVHMGLSTSWFKARFRKETGLPPAEYILRKKVLKAREFLETGKGNVSDAAMKFGFSSSQHFATAFKRYNKQNPSFFVKKKGFVLVYKGL